jgi:two-component system KDP operon response regulator KdpE
MHKKPTILIVEDEGNTRKLIAKALSSRGYIPVEAASVREGTDIAAYGADLVLLDLGLPDGDGCSIIKAIRSRFSIPIIVISGRKSEREKVQALDTGADDYLEKPFGTEELFARIRAQLRRTGNPDHSMPEPQSYSGLELIPAEGAVAFENSRVECTPIEQRILALLVSARGGMVSRQELMEAVWDSGWPGQEKSLKVHISNTRKKLTGLTEYRFTIQAVTAKGYRLIKINKK